MGNILFNSCINDDVDKFIIGTNLIYDKNYLNKSNIDLNAGYHSNKKHEKYLSIYT